MPAAHYGMSPSHPDETLVSIDFVEHAGDTTVVMRHAIPASSPEQRSAVDGWGQSFEKLDAYLATQENFVIEAADELVIVRTFDAPRELVFACWTEPAHFAQWWGPNGFDVPSCSIDAQVGGTALFNMRSAEYGMDMWYGRLHEEGPTSFATGSGPAITTSP